MRPQSNRANYRQHREDPNNEHLGYNEARYAGQDHNQHKTEWQDEAPDYNQNNNKPAYYGQNQRRNASRPHGNSSNNYNDQVYDNNYRDNRNNYPSGPNHQNRNNDYRDWQDDINADRSIQGSRNYMREEHAYGQSNDSMYEANRGNRQSRQNYQDDYNYNNNAQYPYRGDLKAYDTNFDNPENFRKQRRRGFGSRYER